MAKDFNVDHLFKEGLEDYSPKPTKGMEKKMASMIGLSALATGTGTAAVSSVSGASSAAGASASSGVATATSGASSIAGTVASTVSGAASTTIGTSATAIKSTGLLAKGLTLIKATALKSGVINAVVAKSTIVLKSVGIIKTIGAVALITTTTVVVVEEVKEKKAETAQKESTQLISLNTHDDQLTTRNHDANEWTYLMCPQEIEKIKLEAYRKELCASTSGLMSYVLLPKEMEENGLLEENKKEEISNLNPDDSDDNGIVQANNSHLLKMGSSSINSNPPIMEDNMEVTEEETLLQKVNSLSMQSLFLAANEMIFSRDSLILSTPVPQPKTMSSLEKGFYLPNYLVQVEFSMMPMMFSNILSSDKLANDTITSQRMIENEKLSYQFGAALRIQKKRIPFFLQLGLNYQRINEEIDYYFKREYVDHEQSTWQVDTAFSYIINPPNIDTNIERIDSAYIEFWMRSEVAKKSINTYQFLEVPLRFGYQFHKPSSRWGFELSTGVSFAFHLKSNGYAYNQWGQIINIQDTKVSPQVYCYYLANLGLNYHLNKATLFVEPSLRYQLNKKQVEKSTYRSKYMVYGLKFGLRIKLFKNAGQP